MMSSLSGADLDIITICCKVRFILNTTFSQSQRNSSRKRCKSKECKYFTIRNQKNNKKQKLLVNFEK